VNCEHIPLADAIAEHGTPCKICRPPSAASDRSQQKRREPSSPGDIGKPAMQGAKGMVILNGREVTAWWNDGDTFRPHDGVHKKALRVMDYNTLETFGPVHRWGLWQPAELLALSHRATQVAAAEVRRCFSSGKRDGYDRELARCPDLARDLVGQGLAMVYAVDEPPDRELLELQRAAQAEARGIWAKTIPEVILSSVHSADEEQRISTRRQAPERKAYNRVVDTRTGQTTKLPHTSVYDLCQEVCERKGETESCLIYVPFDRRYHDRPACLR
jgi:micrococcal nuclease